MSFRKITNLLIIEKKQQNLSLVEVNTDLINVIEQVLQMNLIVYLFKNEDCDYDMINEFENILRNLSNFSETLE